MGCIALVRCVLVLRCGMALVVWYRYAGCSTSAAACIRIPHHTLNQSNTTQEITQQISRKLLRMDVLTSETCWALNKEIIKQVTSSWSLFIQLLLEVDAWMRHGALLDSKNTAISVSELYIGTQLPSSYINEKISCCSISHKHNRIQCSYVSIETNSFQNVSVWLVTSSLLWLDLMT